MPETFELLLRRRAMPEARSNLAEQIIHAALTGRPVPEFTWREFARSFAELFVLPQPALVFACLLMVGLTLGVTYARDMQTDDLAARELSLFITANNGFSGEFL